MFVLFIFRFKKICLQLLNIGIPSVRHENWGLNSEEANVLIDGICKQYSKLFKIFSENGITANKITKLNQIYDCLNVQVRISGICLLNEIQKMWRSRDANTHAWPKWATEEVFEQISEIANTLWHQLLNVPAYFPYKGGT
jgi:hypothetical protein